MYEYMWDLILKLNWLVLMWIVYISALLILFIFTLYCTSLQGLVEYGKCHSVSSIKSQKSVILAIIGKRISKSYFTHFYGFAAVYTTVLISLMVYSYLTHTTIPLLISYLNILGDVHRNAKNADSVTTIVAMILFLLQVLRRFYECKFVSVFSPTSTMTLPMYFMGVTFYFNIVTSILIEAPGFTSLGFDYSSFKEEYHLNWVQLAAVALYFWAAWHQHRATIILSSIRKDDKVNAKKCTYNIPTGDWFDYVTCPHYFAEILIYLAFNILLKFNNVGILLAWIFTVENQVISAWQSQQFYTSKFNNYPKNRKIIFPYLF